MKQVLQPADVEFQELVVDGFGLEKQYNNMLLDTQKFKAEQEDQARAPP
jgi:hypothetical protein